MNIEVNLASQTHHMPHVGFPQNEPVTIEINAKIHPAGAKLFAINDMILILKTKLRIEAKPIKTKQPSARKDEGT